MLEAVAANARGTAGEVIVSGDFNCPREERADGTVITWAQRIRKDRSIYIKRGYERWDSAERGILEGLPALGLRDAARTIHGARAEMYSYFDIRKGRVCASRRYDHLFASSGLSPLAAKYDDKPRKAGLSDHAPLVVDFETDN